MDLKRLGEALAGDGSPAERNAALEEAVGQFSTAPDQVFAALMDENLLPLDAAIALARHLAKIEPMLEIHLVRRLLATAPDDSKRIAVPLLLRALRLAESVSDCRRLSSHLMVFLRHPSPAVRSKAALLIGRANLNLTRVGELLKSEDSRIRANAVESLWGMTDRKVQVLLLAAVKDPAPRVAVNALIGLCEAGHPEAPAVLEKLALSGDAAMRRAAEWGLRRLNAGTESGSATPSEPAGAGTARDSPSCP